MAGSRLVNFGTIFSRVTGLYEGGAIKELPLWYNVYKKYPPEKEPISDRPEPPQEPILEIVYEEDFERASMNRADVRQRRHRRQDDSNIGQFSSMMGQKKTEIPNEIDVHKLIKN